jgi:hypothetical protein
LLYHCIQKGTEKAYADAALAPCPQVCSSSV